MANTYISSAKVRLYDQRSASILLHPETELSAVFCESGGLLTITGNSIYVASSTIGPVVSSSGFIKEPLLEYTSGGSVTNVGSSAGYGTLLKTIDTIDHVRDTDSATNGYLPTELAVAAALETKQNTLTAGTLIDLSAPQADTGRVTISVPSTTDVMGSTVGLDTKVPTGMAVRVAVTSAKEEAISGALTSVGQAGYATQSWTQDNFVAKGGSGYWAYATYSSAGVVKPISGSGIEIVSAGEIKLSPATTAAIGGVIVPASKGLKNIGGTLTVSTAPIYNTYTSAASQVSSGNVGGVVVMAEIASAATAAESSAAVVPTVNAVAGAVGAEGARLTTWVQNNFLSNTYVPPSPTIGYAGYGTYGLAAVQSSSGIIVNTGVLSLDKATNAQLGGVTVPTSSGLTISNGSLSLASATNTRIGGVIVKESGGLSVNGGTLSVASAPVFPTIESALQSTTYGGVQVITELKQPTSDTETAPIVPNYNVVWNAVYEYSGDFTCTYHAGTSPYITAGSGKIYINGTTVSYSVSPTGQVAVDSGSPTDIWLNITYNASNQNPFSATIASTRATTTGTQSILLARYDTTGVPNRYHKGPIIWDTNEGGGGTEYFGDFKVSCAGEGSTVSITGGSYYLDGGTTAQQINSVSCDVTGTSTGQTLWLNITSGSTVAVAGTTPSMGNTVYSVPLAYVIGSTVCQYQLGPIVIRGRWA